MIYSQISGHQFWLILLRNISVYCPVWKLNKCGHNGVFAVISNKLIGLALNVLSTASELPLYKIV